MAESAGDPHIHRFDGIAFDIDTSGSYSLFDVAGGSDLSVKSEVAPEWTGSKGKYNMKCEFAGSWLHGHNVTAVAGIFEDEAGVYFDRHYSPISSLLRNASQYTREFTEHAKMILEVCHFDEQSSDYCISVRTHRRQKVRGNPHMTMVTDAANVTVRWSGLYHSHVDIYVVLQKDIDSIQIGGLLAASPKHQIRRGKSPLLASSVGAVNPAMFWANGGESS